MIFLPLAHPSRVAASKSVVGSGRDRLVGRSPRRRAREQAVHRRACRHVTVATVLTSLWINYLFLVSQEVFRKV